MRHSLNTGIHSGQFDVVIIGAGSAGCVLARRLVEAKLGTVCLVEAGERTFNPFAHIPIGYYRTIFDPILTWPYQTEPELELEGRRIPCPRGRTIGGSSAINGLVYIRGQRQDFDGWAAAGNTGWSWKDVLPLFIRSEDQARGADPFHGSGGPLGVSDPCFRNAACDAFVDAAASLQIPRNDDFNGISQEGVGMFQLTTRSGLRISTSHFLKGLSSQSKIAVHSGVLVDRITFEGRRARFVEYIRRGRREKIEARRVVVLAAGAIGSPAILMRSGVGDPEQLTKFGIGPVAARKQVGSNLQDHLQARVVFECEAPASLNVVSQSLRWKFGAAAQFLLRRMGPLTIGAGVVGLFTRSDASVDRPDIQFHVMPFSVDRPGEPLHNFPGITMSVCELRPKSRGKVTLRSADPIEPPAIAMNYLSHEEDGWAVIRGLELARRIARTQPLADLIVREREPGAEFSSIQELRNYVRRRGSTIFHPAGSCRMGIDSSSVVDERLRVRGVGSLRVADASIMPTIVSGNTNAACIMIGEKAASMLIEDLRAHEFVPSVS